MRSVCLSAAAAAAAAAGGTPATQQKPALAAAQAMHAEPFIPPQPADVAGPANADVVFSPPPAGQQAETTARPAAARVHPTAQRKEDSRPPRAGQSHLARLQEMAAQIGVIASPPSPPTVALSRLGESLSRVDIEAFGEGAAATPPCRDGHESVDAAIHALLAAGADYGTAETLSVFADRETTGWTDSDGSGEYDQPAEMLDGCVDPAAVGPENDDRYRSRDHGAWQINDRAWSGEFPDLWPDRYYLNANAEMAFLIWQKAGESPWCLPYYLKNDPARATGCQDGPPMPSRPALPET